jgi:uncharacterized protein (DUF1778 family)
MSESVNIPLTTEEHELLQDAARSSRLSVVQWIKITCLKAAKHAIGGDPPPIPSPPIE